MLFECLISGSDFFINRFQLLFRKRVSEFVKQPNEGIGNCRNNGTNGEYFITHADLDLADFSSLATELLNDLKRLEPFGPGNEEPIFRLKDVKISQLTRMGAERNHLRLDLQDKHGKTLKCLAFFAPEHWLNLDPAYSRIEPLVKFTENDFNGIKSLEARIVDLTILDE